MPEIWITNVDYHNDAISRVCARLKGSEHMTSLTRAKVLGMLRETAKPTMVNGRPHATWVNAIYTATSKDGGATYTRGAKVVETKDGNFITTEGNTTKKDNLGNLPPCDC